MSFVTGSPRVLLIHAAWGIAALGLLLLATLFTKRPLLYGAANQILDAEQQREWASNWERYPAFRLAVLLGYQWTIGCPVLRRAGLRMRVRITALDPR